MKRGFSWLMRTQKESVMGDRQRLVLGHSFKFVPRTPGVGIENLPGFRVITNDQPHMSAAKLRTETRFRIESELYSPTHRNPLVDRTSDPGKKLTNPRIVSVRLLRSFRTDRDGRIRRRDNPTENEPPLRSCPHFSEFLRLPSGQPRYLFPFF